MSGIFSAIVLPVAAKTSGVLSRLLGAACKRIATYLGRRAAITCLHGLDDDALDDIGLVRSQIEAAVHGFIPLFAQTGQGATAFAPVKPLRRRQPVPTVEVAPWS